MQTIRQWAGHVTRISTMRNTNFVVKIKRKELHWSCRHTEKNSEMDWSYRVCVRTWNGFNWLKILCSREKWRRCGCTNDALVWPRLLSWDERTTTDTSGCLTLLPHSNPGPSANETVVADTVCEVDIRACRTRVTNRGLLE